MPRTRNGTHRKSVIDLLSVRPRRNGIALSTIDPSETNGLKRRHAGELTLADEKQIMSLQERLHAEGKRSVLIVLQGMDTSGKDGTIRHALQGLNPQGVRIPANHKWYRNWAVSKLLVERMEEMKLTYPKPQLDVRALKKQIKAAA
jgi:polyphosphate kinase 2 (PPK2 family)